MFAILFFPILAMSFDGRVERKKFGPYQVIITQDFKSGVGKILIKQGRKKVFEESDFDSHYYFGNDFDETLKGQDNYSGHNITGNGVANLVISNWTGGAHCCHFLTVFELGKTLKKLVTVESGSSDIRFVDLDHDGVPEIEFWDGAIDYQFASFAGSPAGRVVLKFRSDHYEVSTHLMRRLPPTGWQMKGLKKKIVGAFQEEAPELPFDFLEAMMNLSYSGNFEFAMKLADEVWPSKKNGLEKFKKDFSQSLHDSLYWINF